VEKRKFLTLPGPDLQPLHRPSRSQPLYRLSLSSPQYPGRFLVSLLELTACLGLAFRQTTGRPLSLFSAVLKYLYFPELLVSPVCDSPNLFHFSVDATALCSHLGKDKRGKVFRVFY
jgi:hypothetical protein